MVINFMILAFFKTYRTNMISPLVYIIYWVGNV